MATIVALASAACGRIAFDERTDARAVATDAPCPTCNDGLVAYWPFDETAGMTASDVVGGHDAMIVAESFSWSTTGKRGGAADMTYGFGLVQWDFAAAARNGFTVALWGEPSADTKDYDRYFSQFYYDGTDNGTIEMDNNLSDGVRCILHLAAGWEIVEAAAQFAPIGWRHVACTYDGTDLLLYANGAVVDQRVAGGPVTATEPLAVAVGASLLPDMTAQNAIYGKLDDVRVYNRALTAAEIAALATP